MIPPGHLRLYMREPHTLALGPHPRYALWVQGCPLRCPGCLAQSSLSDEGGELTSIEELADEICQTPNIEGLTLSGGEPFAQAAALGELITRVRARRDLGVIVYTGLTHEQLLTSLERGDPSGWRALYSQTDLLIDGPYIDALNDGGALRGSSNQRALALTPRYRAHLHEYGAPGRRAEVTLSGRELRVIGVPPRDLLHALHALHALPSPSHPQQKHEPKK